MNKLLKIIFIVFLLLHLVDGFAGKYLYKKFIRGKVVSFTNVIEKNDDYDHSLIKNYNGQTKWGNKIHKLCTNNYGYKIKCKDQGKDFNKNIDIAFLGDSFTEGVGVNANNIFVELISNKLSDKNIVNFSVRSYSPIIFYKKIDFLLKKDFKIKELVILMDLSDLADDNLCYKLQDDNLVRRDTFENCYDNFNKKNDLLSNFYSDNFKFSTLLWSQINQLLINLEFKKRYIDKNIVNFFRSSWTYDYNKALYNNQSLEKSLENSIIAMNKLSKILNENSISLSIGVYPHPATLYNDNKNNKYMTTWKDYCELKCKNFYNFNNIFFDKFKNDFYKSYLKYFIKGDVHFNENGHKLMANEFLDMYQ